MNDLNWCRFLRAIAECIKVNRIKGAMDVANSVSMDNMTDSQMRFIRGTCFLLRKHGDHATYVAEQLRRIDRVIQNHGGDSIYNRPRTMRVDLETNVHFDIKTMDFSNLESRISAAMEPAMNKTSTDLRAELAAAEAAEAAAAEVAARQAKLDGYRKLAEATTLLLGNIAQRSTVPSRLLAEHRFELKALAAEFDFRIVLIGDRTQAVLVQA